MASFWLLKTEPTEYSFSDLQKEGKTTWTGVKNPLALKHLRDMKPGDLAFIYHTGTEKQVVGIAEIVSAPFPDPGKRDPALTVVDLAAKRPVPRPVTLAEVKAKKEFAKFELVRMPRLSVMPVPKDLWDRILAMAGE